MCGIAGVFALRADLKPMHKSVVEKLNGWQQHRGPDGEGLWSSDDDAVVFGHRRLAIIDTGFSGAQPMSDVSGRWKITYNGEIYNYRSLRAELERLGCRFRTNSDTEVLIAVVAQWGADGLKRVRGMFAFALYDALQRELWLARDPYGIKPLYVAYADGLVWFASQARALADCAPVDTRREAAALTGFYLWGHVPEPFSWWKDIVMLPPGSVQRIRVGRPLAAPQIFYSIPEAYVAEPPRPIVHSELREVMLSSVRHHLVADIPVGIFLSAGIDSNVIAALAAEVGAKLQTVTLAFDEYKGTPNDEAPLAEAAAKILGSEHATVRIGRDDFEESLDHFLRHMDQPSLDGLNTYLVSRAASSQGLKVALSGLGGDELFGGYPSFRQVPLLEILGQTIPAPRKLGAFIRPIIHSVMPRSVSPKISGLLQYSESIGSAYFLRRAVYIAEELDDLLDASWIEEGLDKLATVKSLMQSIEPIRKQHGSRHAQTSALESCWYMRNQLLHDADWAGMAHGVEIRVPYVDTAVLDHLAPALNSRIPPSKADLAACAVKLPPEMLKRRKTGFVTPVREWTARESGPSDRGLRGWADAVHRYYRTNTPSSLPLAMPLAVGAMS